MRPLAVLGILVAFTGFVSCDRPTTRRTLIVAFGADEAPLTLNRERLGRYPLNAGMCETLVTLTPEFQIAPGLAKSWLPLTPDGVRFNLRRGVQFSDGTPVNAAAVVYTLAHAARLRLGYSFLDESSAKVIDDSTVEVRATRPNRRLAEQLVHSTYGVISPKSDPARRPLCSGPFRFAEYVPYDHLTVVRNERYAGPAAKVDSIIFKFIPDENTRVLALRAGDVDLIYDVGRGNAAALAREPGINVVGAQAGAVLLMYINRNGLAPYNQLSDASLRRAVAAALDRKSLVEHVLGASNARVFVAQTVNPASVLGAYASMVTGVPFDTALARQLVAQKHPTLKLIVQPGSTDRSVAEYVQAELGRVGIAVNIELLDPAAFESRVNGGEFDLDIELPNQNDANPAFLLALRWYSHSGTRSAQFTHASARFDSLVERSLQATDADSVRSAAAAAMHELVDVEVGAIPLAGIGRTYAMRDRVRGFVPHPSRLYQSWGEVWIAP